MHLFPITLAVTQLRQTVGRIRRDPQQQTVALINCLLNMTCSS